MSYKQYEDPEELRRLQLELTEILREVDRVCRVLDIPYVVYGGTAIGAVRHEGFVPWDDDADVCLPRADYERFLAEAPAVMGADFTLDSMRTHANFPATYSYFGRRGTLFVPEYYRGLPYRRPVSVDVFPFDNVADDPRAYRLQSLRTLFWGRLLILRATPVPAVALTGPAKTVAMAATRAVHWVLRTARVSPRFLQARWESAARRYEHQDTRLMADFSDMNPLAWAASREELYPAREVPFEGITVNLPHHYDAVLRRGYGDYLELPPPHQRKNHYPHELRLPQD